MKISVAELAKALGLPAVVSSISNFLVDIDPPNTAIAKDPRLVDNTGSKVNP